MAELQEIQEMINSYMKDHDSCGELSDTYHTFNELYNHRALLFASLCNTTFKHRAWKSLLHHDPNEPMYAGMFIVGIDTPYGQATYHYDIDPYWDLFKIMEVPRAPQYDGHTPEQAIERIYKYALDCSYPTIRTKILGK